MDVWVSDERCEQQAAHPYWSPQAVSYYSKREASISDAPRTHTTTWDSAGQGP